mmetsp:Transcript_37250/g.83448  ORF Transcript_37250/g.83448 Transcript_37250/m.83448 type:complete len:264 (+) Transcript_37250:341-1132(+)
MCRHRRGLLVAGLRPALQQAKEMPVRQAANPVVGIDDGGDGHPTLPHGLRYRRRSDPGHPIGEAMDRQFFPAAPLGVIQEHGGVGGHAGSQGVAGNYYLLRPKIGRGLLEDGDGLMEQLAGPLIHASVGLAPRRISLRDLQIYDHILCTEGPPDGQHQRAALSVDSNEVSRPNPRTGGLSMNDPASVPQMSFDTFHPHIHKAIGTGDRLVGVEVLIENRWAIGCRCVPHVVAQSVQLVGGDLRPDGGQWLHRQEHHPKGRFPC